MKLTRSAGILLHITSLPSPFGIGDMGPEATAFAEFLHQAHQKYWQLLPLNPTERGQAHSPYSSISSRAGNTLLISPDLLADDGLLNADELRHYHLPKAEKADYAKAEQIKAILFDKAWTVFKSSGHDMRTNDFESFCKDEDEWLHDFAQYMLLKQLNNGAAWFQWPDDYKYRDKKVLKKAEEQYEDEIQKTKWLQYIFSKQWTRLKAYGNSLGILFFGDLPFYASYDSADVWANRDLFDLDKDGGVVGVAGVPPDAFSDEGQLWGMPVYVWKAHKKTGYQWWIDRLRRNMHLFDLLRLDHFRAFADYWEVPAGEETAKTGKWKKGPRADFFEAVKKALGDLPFIAEDLGDIDHHVYELRDGFHFAGMKVLQFAFSPKMPFSTHTPHNYSNNFVVYTGTHDNNTVTGWYRNEGRRYHDQLNRYMGMHLTEHNIHLVMCRLAYASVADIAILPMQDVLGLHESARMNIPASSGSNWAWRLVPGQIPHYIAAMLRDWVWLYNRTGIKEQEENEEEETIKANMIR